MCHALLNSHWILRYFLPAYAYGSLQLMCTFMASHIATDDPFKISPPILQNYCTNCTIMYSCAFLGCLRHFSWESDGFLIPKMQKASCGLYTHMWWCVALQHHLSLPEVRLCLLKLHLYRKCDTVIWKWFPFFFFFFLLCIPYKANCISWTV